MRLKTLEMSGFKSFADRTVVTFEEGVTGVVGPNGCGKSNIVDAIRWVMGEMSAKHLRGSAMEDVIFNGCESRLPVGMSQVFLTFDNSDGRAPAEYAQYSEIQVGRRLYRSGESEYFINKTPCRLKDIIDLFLGTGVGTKAYSIVEQGMVGQIISSKPEERRMLIEEAAGISKFKARKEAALRKMESTRTNLARLSDILAELSRQINSLNRQAKKAERHARVSAELRERELSLAATRHRALRSEVDSLAGESGKLREVEVGASAELAGFEAEVEAARLAQTELERELDGIQQELYRVQHAIKMNESEQQHRTRERARLAEQAAADEAESATLAQRAAELADRIGEANASLVVADLTLAGAAESVAGIEGEVERLRDRHGALRGEGEVLQREVMADGEAVATLTAAIEHLERRRVDVTARIARDQSEIDAHDRRRVQLLEEVEQSGRTLDGARQLKLSLAQESEAALATLAQQRAALAEAETLLTPLREELGEKRSRLHSLRELRKSMEGYRDGVRAVLARADGKGKQLAGIVGTVSELVETEPEFETALGAVLGERLQHIVVRSQQEGVEAIDYLRQAASGRSTFIPLDVRLPGEREAAELAGEGVVGPMMQFVRMSDDYRTIGQHLLGDVVLVEDLARALALWEGGAQRTTLVTRDGCVVDPSGVVTGGAANLEEQLVAQKRIVKELEEAVAALGGEATRAEGEAAKLRDRVQSIEESVEALNRDAHSEELKFVGQERDLERTREEFARCEAERDRLTVEAASLAEELRRIEQEQAEAARKREEHAARRADHEGTLAELQSALALAASELGGREQRLTELKVELAQAEERESSITRELADLVRQRVEALVAIGRIGGERIVAIAREEQLGREIEGLRAEMNLALRSVEKLKESQRRHAERFEAGATALREREPAIREVRRRHDEALTSVHGLELKLTEQRSALRYLVDGILTRYHIDLPSAEAQYAHDDLDLEAEAAAVAELTDRLEKIGPVNVDAIQEFGELSERHDFLAHQHADLTASLENLSRAIQKINRTSRQRFRRAFDLVNEQFQMLFPKLFRGGRASLVLTDEENLLETGVEIVAQPPGKKLQSITLLSGGEKALTAVALVFSIFLIKPSPFCLLDEVDAPLDDANIDRFNELIRSMTPHSQFILITHNKRTMELADLLYGVTMEERGVSKLVSVRLAADRAEPVPEEESAVA
jgi:chromosome segregation protein